LLSFGVNVTLRPYGWAFSVISGYLPTITIHQLHVNELLCVII